MKKEEFRKFAKSKLKNNLKFRAKSAHYKVLDRLEKLIEFTNSKKILIFLPLKYEPNLLLLGNKLLKNRVILIPFMVDVSFKMVELRRPFMISRFGVRESSNQNEYLKKIDMAVVPTIGVDGTMARIGHGKGFYDIFFSALKYRPTIVLVSSIDMFYKAKIAEKHDIRGDFYITPTKNYIKRGKYDRNFNSIRCRVGGNWSRISSR